LVGKGADSQSIFLCGNEQYWWICRRWDWHGTGKEVLWLMAMKKLNNFDGFVAAGISMALVRKVFG
jgi:hypothetical protein